jgi:carboxylesterase type B
MIFISYVKINAKSVSVSVKNGIINGKTEIIDDKHVNVFLGIPYAEPPVHDLRFKKPMPIKKWTQPIDATKWPNPCYQLPLIIISMKNNNFSEDCLYLNIWSPISSQSDDSLKAVMFFIHSGAFLYGTSSDEHIDGLALSAMGDVVVITINYRFEKS